MLFMVMTSQSGDRVTKFHITMDSAQEKINNALKVLKFVRSRQTWLRGITQDVELWNEHCHSQPIPVQFLSTQLSIWKSGANFPHSGMPVQNELCGILIEDFLSIWKFRAVFLFGILVILFEGMMDSGVLKYGGRIPIYLEFCPSYFRMSAVGGPSRRVAAWSFPRSASPG